MTILQTADAAIKLSLSHTAHPSADVRKTALFANWPDSVYDSVRKFLRFPPLESQQDSVPSAPRLGSPIRQGASRELAGVRMSGALLRYRPRQILTVTPMLDNTLRLVSWRVDADGAVEQTGDGCCQTMPLSNVAVARGEKVVVAGCGVNGQLRLSSWDISPIGAISYAGACDEPNERISQVQIVAATDTLFITACRTNTGMLSLTSWRLNRDGSLQRLHHYIDTSTPIQNFSLVHLTSSGNNPRLVSAAQTSLGMALRLWDMTPSGQIMPLGSSGVMENGVANVCAVTDEFGHIVTARQRRDGRMRLSLWDIGPDGSSFSLLADSDYQEQCIRDIALMPRPGGLLSAVHTCVGKLKLIAWRIPHHGPITRIGDSSEHGDMGAHMNLCTDGLDGNAPIVTSMSTHANTFKLTTWQDCANACVEIA